MFAWLGPVLSAIGSFFAHAAAVVAHVVAVAARYTWIAVKAMATATLHGLVALGRGIAWVANWIVHTAIPALVRFVENLPLYLKRAFLAVHGWLLKVSTWLNVLYTRVLRPLISAFGLLHTVLQLLARLGVTWAGKLDAELYKIQLYIWSKYSELRGALNNVLSVADLFLDPRGILKRVPFLWTVASLWTDLAAVFAAIHGKDAGDGPPEVPAPARTAAVLKEWRGDEPPTDERQEAAIAELYTLGAGL